jgi:hypothetical protein
MSKKIINTPITEKTDTEISKKANDSKQLTQLADKVIFTPSKTQQKVKARFWTRFTPGPFANPNKIPLALAQEVTGSASLKKWWDEPGFLEWFVNREEARERLEYLFMLALGTAEDLLTDEKAQASAKVNMIKVLAELANKFPSKTQEKYLDDDINKMDEAELKMYLEKKGIVIKQEQVLDVSSEEPKTK